MSQGDTQPVSFRWSKFPAVLTFGIGLASTAFGIYAVAVMFYVQFVQQRFEHVADMLAGCFLYLSTGAVLTLASVFFWHAKIGPAAMFTIVGALIPIVLFSILGP